MVIAVLLQRISYLFSTCWYFKSHKILSRYLNPFYLCPAPDHKQHKVGVVHTNKPTGGENPPKKEPPTGKTQVQQENPHKQEKRATLQHPDKEVKETTPLSPTELLP